MQVDKTMNSKKNTLGSTNTQIQEGRQAKEGQVQNIKVIKGNQDRRAGSVKIHKNCTGEPSK